jgi:hypothetical protein
MLIVREVKVTRERNKLVCADACDRDKGIRWELGRIQVIVKLINAFYGSAECQRAA